MSYYIVKIVLTVILVVAISEIAKRSTFAGALLTSIPLISILAMFWLYIDTRDTAKVSALATSVFWLVLPSLVLFITLPLLLKQGFNFYFGISISIGLTVISYWLLVLLLDHYGIKL